MISKPQLSQFTIVPAKTTAQNISQQILYGVRLTHLRPYCNEESIMGRKGTKLQPLNMRAQISLSSFFYKEKKYIIGLMFMFFYLINYSQNVDSLKNKNPLVFKGFYISGGISTIQYPNNKFFNYLFTQAGPIVHLTSGGPQPSEYEHDKSSSFPMMNIGIELNKANNKKIKFNHDIGANIIKVSGKYSYNVHSNADYSYIETGIYWIVINDNSHVGYTQSIISLHYAFQPTYKYVFLSLGVISSLNLVKVEQQKQIQRDLWFYDVGGSHFIQSYKPEDIVETINNLHFFNGSFQVGTGLYIKLRRVTLKPCFYFTPYLSKGYNFYTVFLTIMMATKKPVDN